MGPKSVALLGWSFLVHVLRRATFTWRRKDMRQFRANFDPDHLLPVPEADRAPLADWHACVACGLCDQVCPELLGPVGQGHRLGPQAIAAGVLGDLSAHGVVVAEVEALSQCEDCGQCEALCPVGLPLRQIADFIVRNGRGHR